jgi:hypothetical protein
VSATLQHRIPLTRTQAAKLRRALTTLLRATIDDTWKGGGDPADIPLIESELRSARASFWSLFQQEKTTSKVGSRREVEL